jgi:hypothetical protein
VRNIIFLAALVNTAKSNNKKGGEEEQEEEDLICRSSWRRYDSSKITPSPTSRNSLHLIFCRIIRIISLDPPNKTSTAKFV